MTTADKPDTAGVRSSLNLTPNAANGPQPPQNHRPAPQPSTAPRTAVSGQHSPHNEATTPASPVTELRAAAFQLRNPFHGPGLNVGVDSELGQPLANWLDLEADVIAARLAQDGSGEHAVDLAGDHALAIARLINGEEAQ